MELLVLSGDAVRSVLSYPLCADAMRSGAGGQGARRGVPAAAHHAQAGRTRPG